MECVEVTLNQTLYDSGCALHYAYFPLTSIISLMYVTLDGGSSEIAVIGKEGMVGVALFMGGASTNNRAMVQNPGLAYRVPSSILKQEFEQHGPLQDVLLCYAQSLITQMAQTAVCNRHHSIDQQLARWLLQRLDRLPTIVVKATQEMIGQMLGVRREGVTEAAGKLQTAGLIQYSRGHITVISRTGLEQRVCECYDVVKREDARLTAMVPSSIKRLPAINADKLHRETTKAICTSHVPTESILNSDD